MTHPVPPKTHRKSVAISMCLLLVAMLGPRASAYTPPGPTDRVSLTATAGQANGATRLPAISADGSAVAFESAASNLVPGDTNDTWDVFVRAGGTTERVSVASDGTEANGRSRGAAISVDGRFVAFTSEASNLVPGDTNEAEDVFLHDRVTGVTERVSLAADGGQGDDASFGPALTADGRTVAFASAATNLVAGDTNGVEDLFVRDLDTDEVELVSVATDGTPGDEGSSSPSISADGRYVAFDSSAATFAPGDTDEALDVFVRDRTAGTTERASAPSDGVDAQEDPSMLPGWAWSASATISADGRSVAFTSHATNLVPGDTNRAADTFVRDLESGTTERVSVTTQGEQQGPGWSPSISGDGRLVAFQHGFDVVVHDRATGATEIVSTASNGAPGNSLSYDPSISADGRLIAFSSVASNLVAGDTNAVEDVFVHDQGPPVGVGGLDVFDRGGSVAVTGWARFPGKVLSAAPDPVDDAVAGAAGADLAGATVIHRPESSDIQVRLQVPDLLRSRTVCFGGCATTPAGAPGILYGLEFRYDFFRYEVRGVRPATTATQDPPRFALYYCPSVCFEVEGVAAQGGIGTTGEEVVLTFPLIGIGDPSFGTLTGVRAFTSVAPAEPGAGPNAEASPAVLDEVLLPDGAIRGETVELGIAPAGTSVGEVPFGDPVPTSEGRFESSLSTGGLAPGAYEVWARACVAADACGTRSTPFTLE